MESYLQLGVTEIPANYTTRLPALFMFLWSLAHIIWKGAFLIAQLVKNLPAMQETLL